MQTSTLFIVILGLSLLAYYAGLKRARQRRDIEKLQALPSHYGYMTAMLSAIPAALLLLGWSMFEPSYLDRQIEIIRPKVIVTLGRHSMNEFLPDVQPAPREPADAQGT